jgi:hypothetical protein
MDKINGLAARLNRLLKKSKQQIARGLRPARDVKNKRLITAQLKLHPFKTGGIDFFSKR